MRACIKRSVYPPEIDLVADPHIVLTILRVEFSKQGLIAPYENRKVGLWMEEDWPIF